MIYVNGDVSVSGPSSGAAVQNNSMLTLTADGDITQTGNLTYATKPVTTSGTPIDSLVSLPASASYQVLGLYTANGEVIFTPSSGNTLETDASIAVISSSPSCGSNCGKIATGKSFNTWTNIGGRAENSINSVGFSTGNVYFDQRFKQWKFAPPWFPQTAIGQNDLTNVLTTNQTYSVQRVQWYSSTGGQ